MAEDPNVNALRIQLETLSGTVQLAGLATHPAEKDRAGPLARNVSGVRDVRNSIIVRAPGTN